MSSYKISKSAYSVVVILVQFLLFGWMVSDVVGQYDFDNTEGSLQQNQQQTSRMPRLSSVLNNPRTSWDSVNQAILEKCIQMQTMTLKKRNFGLEIPDIIMNRVQGGTEGSTNLKDLRMRMVANGK